MPRARGIGRALCAVAALAWLALVWRFDFLADDAFISFRYARRLAAGQGLRFNLSETGAPVEGYTNLLWTAALAGFERLGMPSPASSRALSIGCGAALLALVARHLARTGSSSLATGLALCFLATLPPFAAWSTGGLETMAFALALFATYDALAGQGQGGRPRAARAALAAACTVLLRADGAAFAAAALVSAWLHGRLAGSAQARPALRAAAIAAGLALVAQLAFRLGYHGDWLPHTARAKLHPGQLDAALRARFLLRGALYAASAFVAFLSLPLALGASLAVLRARSAQVLPPLAVATGVLGHAVLAGGDFMALGRFLVPALPFLALVLARALDAQLERGRARVAWGVGAAACALSLMPAFGAHLAPRDLREALDFRWGGPYATELAKWREQRERARRLELLGRALARHTRPGESIALSAIGAVAYRCELDVLDLHGLVDRDVSSEPPEGFGLPGHDRLASEDVFRRRGVTYLGARLVSAEDPLAGLPPELVSPAREGSAVLDIRPLEERDGFPPGMALLLVRA